MRSAVIIRMGNHIAMIERVRAGKTYYLFPGGTVEPGETLEMTAIREIREELGLEVQLGRLAALVEFNGQLQYYFWANAVAGTFGTGDGEELRSSPNTPQGSYHPIWLPVDQFVLLDVRPKEVADALGKDELPAWSGARYIQERELRHYQYQQHVFKSS